MHLARALVAITLVACGHDRGTVVASTSGPYPLRIPEQIACDEARAFDGQPDGDEVAIDRLPTPRAEPDCASMKPRFFDALRGLRESGGASCAEARDRFLAIWVACPSPGALEVLAGCSERLDRIGEAIEAWQRVLDDGGVTSPERRAWARKALAPLEEAATLVHLRKVPPGPLIDARRGVEGVEVEYRATTRSVRLHVRPGQHEFRAGNRTLRVDIPAKGELTLAMSGCPGA